MNTDSSKHCPHCHTILNAQGLCPKCLMARAATLTEDGTQPSSNTIPALDEVARAFPELEVLELIGRGGMGVVYKARQKSLNRLVALKLLAPERVQDPKFAERFEKEAQALAALNHPGIVTVHDFGHVTDHNGSPLYFLLMEFVDGVNLRQAMKAGRFTPEQALAIVPPVCEALQFAHQHGIVHRDIKPENLLLDRKGRLKIADFGIAKILGNEAADSVSQPVGTPRYMAPEQEGGAVDHRADIYSLGVVLYELLTGELPGNQLLPPSQRVQIDVRLDEVVLRALNEKPELRWQTATDFRTQVETITNPVKTPAPATKNRWLVAGGALASLILGLIGIVLQLYFGPQILPFALVLLLCAIILGILEWRHPWGWGKAAALGGALQLIILSEITLFRFWRNISPSLGSTNLQLISLFGIPGCLLLALIFGIIKWRYTTGKIAVYASLGIMVTFILAYLFLHEGAILALAHEATITQSEPKKAPAIPTIKSSANTAQPTPVGPTYIDLDRPPQLRFLQLEYSDGKAPIRTSSSTPILAKDEADAQVYDINGNLIGPMSGIPDLAMSSTSKISTHDPDDCFLQLYFEHPSWDTQTSVSLEILNTDGSKMAESFGGYSNSYGDTSKRLHLFSMNRSLGKRGHLPSAIRVILHYSIGPWSQPFQVSTRSDVFQGRSDIILGGRGANKEGNAFLNWTRPPARQFSAVAILKNGNHVSPTNTMSSISGESSTKNSEVIGAGMVSDSLNFSVPFSEVESFEISSRPMREVVFDNVKIPPLPDAK